MIPALEELEVYASLDKVSGSSFNRYSGAIHEMTVQVN